MSTAFFFALVSGLFAAAPDAGAGHAHAHHDHGGAPPEAAAQASSHSLYHLQSEWTDEAGRPRRLSSFKGQVVVLAMIYTSCESVCPMIVSEMQQLERGLTEAAREKVRFVLVSFDPARDRPPALARYARARGLDPRRWVLLTAGDDAVRELAAVLGMRYRPSGKNDFAHSNLVSVLDQQGVIVHRREGLGGDPAPAIAAVARLASPAR